VEVEVLTEQEQVPGYHGCARDATQRKALPHFAPATVEMHKKTISASTISVQNHATGNWLVPSCPPHTNNTQLKDIDNGTG
jgi:hypothetical protein